MFEEAAIARQESLGTSITIPQDIHVGEHRESVSHHHSPSVGFLQKIELIK
jgi:hypothetical protein